MKRSQSRVKKGINWNCRLNSVCDLIKYVWAINLNIEGKEERFMRKQKHREEMTPKRYLHFPAEENQTYTWSHGDIQGLLDSIFSLT